MRAPRLNRALVLEAAERVADGAGGHVLSWVALGTLWAEVKPGSGRERAGEFVTLSTVPYRITVRASAQDSASRPRPEQRLRDGARVFRIAAVSEADAAGLYLTCFAHEEVVA
ncbi:MAG: phage tail protein [Alphaproteobacteria bacterium HGW-Alphaproteobacteria-4]|jgi:head-tail adaptor|nr:MAG: phage tail protein [Alphaproteobacteria bacterium HGW-Alphaproteobacteria-4]